MSWTGSEEPPAKRQRFFDDPEEDNAAVVAAAAPRLPLADTVDNQPLRAGNAHGAQLGHAPPQGGFNQEMFQSVVGEAVDPSVLRLLQGQCGNDVSQAINTYLDTTWMHPPKPSLPEPAARCAIPECGMHKPAAANALGPASSEANARPSPVRPMPESRYIGAFGAEGWATRSGTLLKFGDVIKIERPKVQPGLRRVDVIVRFTDARGSEIGRLTKDSAHWVSSLLDQDVCRLEGTCVYAPERLRSNDTIFLQLRCYILRAAFENGRLDKPDNRSIGLYESHESPEERKLRLRQVALVKLFQEINLTPTRTNAASTSSHGRKELLAAAEAEENKEKEKTKTGNKDPGSSPPSEEAEDGEELEQDQLDALYRKAQSFDFNTPEAEPPDTFAMTLRPYQKQALHWMLSKEKDQKNEAREASMHPLWEEYTWPTKDVDDKDVQVQGQENFYMNPYSGEMSLEFPAQEQHCLGGILADEMGLGKTIQMLSLIHAHKSEAEIPGSQFNSGVSTSSFQPVAGPPVKTVPAPRTTLVIAPMSLLAQWQSEAEGASKEGTLKSLVYYGNEKAIDLRSLLKGADAPDVVITSYGVILSEYNQMRSGRGAHSGIFSLEFFRIILDEAHTIKNRQSKTSKACYELSAQHRWVLTGTPIVNRLEDLFSLVRFLKVEPWNNFSFWRTFITVPFESKNFMRALDVVQTVLEPLVMRRTKDMKTPDGQFLVALPPKRIEIVDIELSQAERHIYDHVFTRAKRTLSANVDKGTVMKAYTTIFAQILRLRQTCCHPILVRNQEVVADEEISGAQADAAAGLADDMDLQSLIEQFTATTDEVKDANKFGAHVLQQIRDDASNECPVCCEEPMIDRIVTGCWHSACKGCLLDYIKRATDRHEVPRCFNCREAINVRDIFQVVRHDDDPDTVRSGPKISLQRLGVNESSSKVVALIKHLRDLRAEHPRMKSVVFSQFTSFMSLIEPALTRANMRFLRLDGSISQKGRAAVLKEFQESNKFTILLLSLKAGGVGLNLTSAKRVFMMDPWWSFAVEAQAIDRVHRMGQDDEVKVYRFICKDSVEERMLKVQDRKKFIATSLGMMSDEEKRLGRIEDIKELLS